MDFVFDYDDDEPLRTGDSTTTTGVNLLPIPAPPLNLSNLNNYREDLTQKFSNLNILKNLQQKHDLQLKQSSSASGLPSAVVGTGGGSGTGTGSGGLGPEEIDVKDTEQAALASRYAQLSLDLIREEDRDLKLSSYISAAAALPMTGVNSSVSSASASAVTAGDTDNHKPTAVLSARLARVLNTSNFDSGIREALVLLQSRIAEHQFQQQQEQLQATTQAQSQTQTQTKAQGQDHTALLSIDYDTLTDTGLVGSVSRRKLRNEIENDLLRQQFQTLKGFQPIVKRLSLAKEKLENLNRLNAEISENLANASARTKSLKDTVSELERRKDLISLKKHLLKNFQRNYTLTRYEEFHLINDDIDDEYLQILQKAESVHRNCSILLSMDNPQMGLAIMNEMSEIITLATKRIANFIKRQFQNFFLMGNNSDLDSIEKHAVFKKSLVYVITKRTEHLSEIIDELINSRSKILVEEFLTQVNGYSDSLNSAETQTQQKKKRNKKDDSRPLMLSIYDSKRFLGDILAYLHDVIVNERELLNNLFDIEDSVISSYDTTSSAADGSVADIVKLVDDIIERNLAVLARPARSRIEHIIRSENKLVVLQHIFQLFDLYSMMYAKALHSSSNGILNTVAELQKLTAERILSVTKQKLNNIQFKGKDQDQDMIEEIDDDLNIPEWLIEFYGSISPLFDNIQPDDKTFMNFNAANDAAFQEMVFDRILEILDLQITQNKLASKSKSVFKLNCYDFISSKLIVIKLLSGKWRILNEKMTDLKKELCTIQFQLLLRETNLIDIYNLINMIFPLENDYFELSIYEPITENKLFSFKFFKEVNFRLMEVLPLALIDHQQEELSKILSPSISNDISIDSSIEFVNLYYKLWLITQKYLPVTKESDIDPDNFDKHPVFKWSDVEVATLLGCEEHYSRQKEHYKESSDDENDEN